MAKKFICKQELKRQITREGKRWGVVPMDSVFGDVLCAEDIPCMIPLGNGISCVEKVRRDITAMSLDYPWFCILRNRKYKGERSASLRAEIKEAARVRQIEQNLDDIYHELSADIRKADKQIVRIQPTWA